MRPDRETYNSSDPSSREQLVIETDPTLTEVLAEIDGVAVCLDPSQVGAIVRQMTSWLAERAR